MTEFRDQDRKLYMRSFIGNSVFSVLSTTALYGMFGWVAWRVLKGGLTVGDIAIYGGVTSRLRRVARNTFGSFSSAMEETLYLSHLMEFLNAKPGISSAAGLTPTSSQGEIQIKNVSFAYPGTPQPVLSDVSLHITPGETVALVGENGAGKTTLVKLIARLYDPDVGGILFDGIDLRELSLDYLHKQVAFVFQHFNRYEATAADNIAYGDWQRLMHNREQVESIARLANVHDMIDEMSEGYDTLLGRKFGEYTLSGGQWQKIAVARAFAREASLFILDEPTSNLDARAEYELFSRFRELARGRTTILISHRFSTVSMADRILMMDKGRIIEGGTHQELLAQAGHYAKLYNLHVRQRTTHFAE
jgi:ATP-binding cassette subfamily B protein